MKIKELIEKLKLKVRCGGSQLDREIARGYASDLMSDVMAHSREGDIWITLQVHLNIVAVACMTGIAAIVLINNREPEKETLEKAEAEGVPLLVSELPAFELIGRLYSLGIPGISEDAE
ncbi:MAG: hypothetical protein JW969_12095 [Spirochaetales bacterium]|nr:hypothetical protein [Spirochaetales bacterium]